MDDNKLAKFEEQCLVAHNKCRNCHGVDPLIIREDLKKKAQKWAERLAKEDVMKHSKDEDMGENVAFLSVANSGEKFCKLWYDEYENYDYAKPGFAADTGHFTQVVWKATKYMGLGVAQGKRGVFAVANYHPPGNSGGIEEYAKNVTTRDREPVFDIPSSDSAQKLGTKTTIKEYVEKGKRMRETTTVTTTLVGGQITTKTSTKIENL